MDFKPVLNFKHGLRQSPALDLFLEYTVHNWEHRIKIFQIDPSFKTASLFNYQLRI